MTSTRQIPVKDPSGGSTRRMKAVAQSGQRALAAFTVLFAALGLPVVAPQALPILAVARADCPPLCNPGNGSDSANLPNPWQMMPPPQPADLPQYQGSNNGYPPPADYFNPQATQQTPNTPQQSQQLQQASQSKAWQTDSQGNQNPADRPPLTTEQLSREFEAAQKQYLDQLPSHHQQPEPPNSNSSDSDVKKCLPVEGDQVRIFRRTGIPFTNEKGELDPSGEINIYGYYNRNSGIAVLWGEYRSRLGIAEFPTFNTDIQHYNSEHARPGDVLTIVPEFDFRKIRIQFVHREVPVEICDRTKDGKFAGGSGYAKDSEEVGIAQWEAANNQDKSWTIFRQKVLAKIQDGSIPNNRYFDGIACKDGECVGIEVKSGTATKSSNQREFDNAVNSGHPAIVTFRAPGDYDGTRTNLSIVKVVEIRVP